MAQDIEPIKCPHCKQVLMRHCASPRVSCKWLWCPKCNLVFGPRNFFKIKKAKA